MTDKHLQIPLWPDDLIAEVRKELVQSNRTLVVLDDDPTGTQTVYDVPVLTQFDQASLGSVLASNPPVLFLLTNSRAMNESESRNLHLGLAHQLRQAGLETGRRLELISRSDSTLRGHFPLETDALAEAWPEQSDLTLVMPFFAEGGRLTIDGQHFVCDGEQMQLAHETPFAKDSVFGFQHSFLPDWIKEKTKGRIGADAVVLIPLEVIRSKGPAGVKAILDDAATGAFCVADAASDEDAAVVAAAIGQSERTVLARVAASYVRARAGLTKQPLLTTEQLLAAEPGETGGLIMVGSHVPKTTQQLNHLMQSNARLTAIELRVEDLLESAESAVTTIVNQLNESLEKGSDTVVYTSRQLVQAESDNRNLEISNLVSGCVSEVVANLSVRPRYLIAKGGITSSDIATRSLNVRLATVAGSILPGIPVWRIGDESKFPGMHYVIFPGNVGGVSALSEAVEKLTRG